MNFKIKGLQKGRELLENEKCGFVETGGHCYILVGIRCDGTDKLCKFRKTKEQFQHERDRSIIINRVKGNCEQCRYMGTPCRLSTEEER